MSVGLTPAIGKAGITGGGIPGKFGGLAIFYIHVLSTLTQK